jgi:hypothetical protein
VAACIVANVWTVALAADESGVPGIVARAGKVSADVGLRGDTSNRPAADDSPDATAKEAGTAGRQVVSRGNGRLTPVAIPDGVLRTATDGRTVRISVETEGGLPVDATEFARTVATVLTDARGWQREDAVRFVEVTPQALAKGARVDLRIALASPDTTDRLCTPLQTRGQVSCHNNNRAVVNLVRWQNGAGAYGSDLAGYRTYLVNHEVGHGLGHGHEYCSGEDRVAPLMMQQTYGLRGCTAWPWPTPKSA